MKIVSVSVLSPTSLSLKWNPPEIGGNFIDTYIITAISSTCPNILPKTTYVPPHQTHIILNDLEEGMAYHVLITARNTIGDSILVDVMEKTLSAG